MTEQRKRIGFFIGHLGWEGHYTNALWRAAVDDCKRRGFDLLLFTGPQDIEDYVAQQLQSSVFRLVDPRRVDGLILSSSVKSFGIEQWLPKFAQEFPQIPVVCIAEKIPGVPAVQVDNASGMQSLVEHLILVHGYRDQAFIKGRSDAQDGNVRYETWLRTLAAHDIEANMEWVIQGNFVTVGQGQRLVDAWHSGRRFGVVVAANDLMAADMIAIFRRAGIRVPEDIAVVGFDDGPQNRYSDPPLSSVYQPIGAQVEAAIDILVAMWESGGTPTDVTMPTTVRIRASCGCGRSDWSVDPQLRKLVLEATAVPATFGDSLAQCASAAENSAECTFDILTAIDALQAQGDLMETGISDAELGASRSRLFIKALSDLQLRRWDGPALEALVLETCRAVAGATQLAMVDAILASSLPSLGMGQYCFSVIPTLVKPDMETGSPHVAQCGEGLARFTPVAMFPQPSSPSARHAFAAALLAPDAWIDGLRQSSLVILPIASRSTWYGIFACEMAPGRESLALQLQGALVLVCEREEQIIRSMRQKLSEWSRSLILAEKSKTTGALVRGVAHEINTPLGVCVTLTSSATSNLQELANHFNSGTMSRQYMSGYIGTSGECLVLIEKNLYRMADLVRTFKKVSVSEYATASESFDLAAEVRALVDHFSVDLQARFIAVDVEAANIVRIQANRSIVQEIASTLIQNVMDHAFPVGMHAKPTLSVSVIRLEDEHLVQLRVADNGVGIAPELRHQVFEPFFTTKRFMSHVGLGLAIARGLAVEGLGGTMEYSHEVGGGVAFVVTFAEQSVAEGATEDLV
jgi:DNA-binding LacI/PurR family transcriptional regulator/signal transduction histidine kinase